MNLSQAKIQLEKIIALYKSMSADEKNISAIERDLMLGYIRQLYENFLDASPSVPAVLDNRPAKPAPSPPPPQPVAPPTPAAKVSAPVAPKPVVAPPPPPVYEYEAPKVETPPPPPEPPRPKPTPSVSTPISGDIALLFEESSGRELSDRLANTPVADLTKAFGLNDRLLTQNELFGGNKSVFDEIVKDLNNASSFDAARGYLIDLAKRYHWAANADRQKHAKAFINLVRRRFK